MKNEKNVALNAREYIKFWFQINDYTARKATRNGAIFSTIVLDYQDFFNKFRFKHPDLKVKPFPEANLKHAFGEYMHLQMREDTLNALKGFECDNEDLEPLQAWIQGITGKCSPKDVAVMAHWVWMIKRKGFALPVKHHVMPVLYGIQGGGKSTAIERFIKPIEEYKMAIGMNQLADERMFEGMANNYVIVFDELQGIERTDMNSLKKQITATFNSYRKLYTHDVQNVEMRCSFIGATNRPMAESFSDSTGMRRFWEIVTLDKLDWKGLGDINYKELWLGIDERNEDGYLTGKLLQEVLVEQQEHVNKDDLEEFLSQNIVKPIDTDPVSEIDHNQIYDAYVHWAGRNGITTRLNSIWFGRKLRRRVAYEERRDEKGVRRTAYKINSNSPLLQH